jgi:hypothetical protein
MGSRELSGYGETATVGDNGVAISGDGGFSRAGEYGIAISGDGGVSVVGDNGVAISGVGGTAAAGAGGSISIMGDDDDEGVRYTVTGIIEGELQPDVVYQLVGHTFEVVG